MANDTLTGIERDLVIQYLIDGNIPVTLTPIEEEKTSYNYIHSVNSNIFPVALKPDAIKVFEEGIIVLENPPQSVIAFSDKTVKVEFYFHRVGLFFISKVVQHDMGLTIKVPDEIFRIKDVVDEPNYDFSACIYVNCNTKQDMNYQCYPWDKQELFTRPVWKSIPLENQKKAKELLEQFVAQAKVDLYNGRNIGGNAGNGIQLVPICNYLTNHSQNETESIKAFQPLNTNQNSLDILYVDHERIVLGKDKTSDNTKEMDFLESALYGVKLSFSLKNSPILSRDIFVICTVNKIYSTDDNSRFCLDFVYSTIQEEDLRYLYEKATKLLFI